MNNKTIFYTYNRTNYLNISIGGGQRNNIISYSAIISLLFTYLRLLYNNIISIYYRVSAFALSLISLNHHKRSPLPLYLFQNEFFYEKYFINQMQFILHHKTDDGGMVYNARHLNKMNNRFREEVENVLQMLGNEFDSHKFIKLYTIMFPVSYLDMLAEYKNATTTHSVIANYLLDHRDTLNISREQDVISPSIFGNDVPNASWQKTNSNN